MVEDPETPDDALAALLEGNARFAGRRPEGGHRDEVRVAALAAAQAPWATIVSCIDSRVPAELVFDVGFGDLFVVRTAGQALDDVAVGSIEFCVAEFGVPLVAVVGHSSCGAVAATVRAVEEGTWPPGRIGAVVDRIRPAVEATAGASDPVGAAVEANVAGVVADLRQSPVLGAAERAGELWVVGAVYDLASQRVTVTTPPAGQPSAGEPA